MELEIAVSKSKGNTWHLQDIQHNYPVLHNLKLFLTHGFWISRTPTNQYWDYAFKTEFSYHNDGIFRYNEWAIKIGNVQWWHLSKNGKHLTSLDDLMITEAIRQAERIIENQAIEPGT